MELAIATTTQTDRLADKLRAARVIVVGDNGHPHLDMDRVEELLDQVESTIRSSMRRAFMAPMETMTGPITTAETQRVSPSQDYFELKRECWELLNRVLIEGGFLADVVPSGISWTHVAGLTAVRNQLRDVNDLLFGEGACAP